MPLQGTAENVLTASTFSLEIDQVTRQFFVSVDGLSADVQVVDRWVSNEKGVREQKVAGTTTFGDFTVVANLTTDSYIRDWRQEVVEGKYKSYRRNGSVVIYDTEGGEQARFNFVNGWPSSYSLSELTAGSSAVMTESITIVHEGLVRA